MCDLLHHRVKDALPVALSADRLYQLALMIDKYGCFEALALQSQALISRYLESISNPATWADGVNLVVAAYLVRDPRGFASATHRLMIRFNAPFSSIVRSGVVDVVPHRALRKLKTYYDTVATH